MRSAERNDGSRGPFDALTIFFHWLTALLVTLLGVSGFAAVFLEGTPLAAAILLLHRSMGILVWSVTALRFIWRASFARFPAFPGGMPRIQRWLVTKSEQFLYALLLVQPLTGLLTMLTLGRPFAIFMWTVPALFPRDIEWHLLSEEAHLVGAVALLVLAGGHAFMGLVHHYILRDDVLSTMAPWVKERAR